LAIDQQGNLWIPNNGQDSVTKLDYLGTPLSPNTTINTGTGATMQQGGFLAGSGQFFAPTAPQSLAIDQNGNVWVADVLNCLIGITPAGTAMAGSPYTASCGSGNTGSGVAVDASNNIWVVGNAPGTSFVTSVTAASPATPRSGFPVTTGFTGLTGFIGPDYSGHMWFTDSGSNQIDAMNANGTLFVQTPGVLAGPTEYSAFGHVGTDLQFWVPEPTPTNNIQPVDTANPALLPSALLPVSEQGPTGIAADGASNFYTVMYGGGSVPANITAVTPTHTIFSPVNTGFTGGTHLTSFDQPQGVAIDQSGNLWVLNLSNSNSSTSNPTYTNSRGIHYLDNGAQAANVTEVIGFAVPSNPVFTKNAQAGAGGVTAAGAYGVKP
jgi:hypothetical protein